MKKKILYDVLFFALGIVLICLVYEVFSLIKQDKYYFPGLEQVFKDFFKLLGRSNTYLSIFRTILNLVIAIAISFVAATIFAIIAYRFIGFYKTMRPLMALLRTMPIIIVINVIWFLLAMKHKDLVLYFSVFSVLFPIIYEAIYQSLISIDKQYIDAYKLYSNLKPIIIFRVYIPLAFESYKSSLINSIGLGIKIALSVEFIIGIKDTLGYLIQRNINGYSGFSMTYAYLIILVIVSALLELLPLLIGFIYKKIKYREREIILED